MHRFVSGVALVLGRNIIVNGPTSSELIQFLHTCSALHTGDMVHIITSQQKVCQIQNGNTVTMCCIKIKSK